MIILLLIVSLLATWFFIVRKYAIKMMAEKTLDDILLLRKFGLITHIQATVLLNELNDLKDVYAIVATRKEVDELIKEAREEVRRLGDTETR